MLLSSQRVVLLLTLVTTVGVLLLCRNYQRAWQFQQQFQQHPGASGSSNGGSGNVSGGQRPAQMAIPFFRSGDDDDDALSRWSHLNHKVEEYRQDLVTAVQSLDMIINTLESAAAPKANARAGDMPGEGMRRLAAKLRRKLNMMPPRWQVNADVLTCLLRPVPFVAGLPVPSPPRPPTPPATSNYDTDQDTGGPVGKGIEYDSSDAIDIADADGDVSDAGGGKEGDARTKQHEAVRVDRGDDATGESFSAGSAGPAAAEERRAMPVPIFQGMGGGDAGGGGGGGGDGKAGSKKRTGFHSYDDTHQIFTHILRDWTSEGDSVRAAVYTPLLQALDDHFGWQEDGTAARHSAGGRDDSYCSGGGLSDTDGGHRGGGSCGGQGDPPPATTPPACGRTANVLVPGAGLGRLAAEVAARGYASVHANELSTTMLSSCYWLMEALRGADFTGTAATPTSPLTRVGRKQHENGDASPSSPPPPPPPCCVPGRDDVGDCGLGADEDGGTTHGEAGGGREGGGGPVASGKGFFQFYPFLNDATHNEMDGEARFRSVLFPDPEGRALLARASGRLSFQAGEFSETYGGVGGPYEAAFDAVVTSFFVDTAPNVVQYVATIRRALRPGGVWINCGPLHWHNHSALALSLDEMLVLVEGSGFRLEEGVLFGVRAGQRSGVDLKTNCTSIHVWTAAWRFACVCFANAACVSLP
ncbi:unnamed protein product, partial [Ectocarpus fasciculatus]